MTDSLGDRMKGYEASSSSHLTRKVPVILRLDGKAFHTITKGLDKPYDMGLIELMKMTAEYLVKNIQGAKLAFVQSDEISILLTDYETELTDSWFGYNAQKMTSISASMATYFFNANKKDAFFRYAMGHDWDNMSDAQKDFVDNRVGLFDCRCFSVPREDVANCFLWRAKDWHRNSVNMKAQALYPHKALQGLKLDVVKAKLFDDGKPWEIESDIVKNGSWVQRKDPNNPSDSSFRHDVFPTYQSVAAIVEPYIKAAPSTTFVLNSPQ